MRNSVRVAAAGLSAIVTGAALTGMLDSREASIPTLIIGGSAAKGWHDQSGQGYLVRALAQYGSVAGVHFLVQNQAIPGARVVNARIASNYLVWMRSSRGGLVVIAWGFLNDLRLGTRTGAMLKVIHREIALAVATNHTVLLVSPPATTPTFTFDAASETRLWHQVSMEAEAFHSQRVFVADVLGPMKRYVRSHHQSYRRYMDGTWDPNTAGHRLAARILSHELTIFWSGLGTR